VKVVVRFCAITDQFRQELQTLDAIDRVAEVLDAAGEVEDDDQGGVYLVGYVVGEPSSFCVEGTGELAELGCEPLSLASTARSRQPRHVPTGLGGTVNDDRRTKGEQRPGFSGHSAA
jgi:hypothetical protein